MCTKHYKNGSQMLRAVIINLNYTIILNISLENLDLSLQLDLVRTS